MWAPFFFRGHPYIWRTTVRHDMHAARNSIVIGQTQVQFGSQTLPGNQIRFYFYHVSHHQYIKERSDSIKHLLLSYNMAHTTINVLSCPTVLDFSNRDSFFDSTHRAIPFLPNPGCHPWCDQAVPSTSRRWCLREYTYSRRISLWNIQHDKCLCRYLIIIAGILVRNQQMNKPNNFDVYNCCL